MKSLLYTTFVILMSQTICAQNTITLAHATNNVVKWEDDEKSYFSEIWQNQVITNVSVPTLEIFEPKNPNGTSVIIAPGGGLYALSIENEGTEVAQWLNKKGITAFVLKYRLVPTGEDGVQEITEEGTTNPKRIGERITPILPLSIADGLSAISYVRSNASGLNIDPNKIGFMGFSAGGTVTMGVAYNYTTDNRPDFIVPVYAWTTVLSLEKAPKDAPPMLVFCASDDPLGLAKGSIELYASWLKAEKKVGLHMFAEGGHGFGMDKQNLPSDNWIQLFYNWSIAEGLTTPLVLP